MPNKGNKSYSEHSKPDQTPPWKIALEVMALIAAVTAIYIYKGQWDAAKDSNMLNGENNKAQQRAWVGIDYVRLFSKPINTSDPVRVDVAFKNFGQTVALNTRYKVEPKIISNGNVAKTPGYEMIEQIRPLQEKMDVGWETHTIPQGKSEIQQTQFPVFTPEQIELLRSRSVYLFVYGKAQYEDIFGSTHRTTFCAYLDLGSDPASFAECGSMSSMK